jgi:hypothetical protein
MQNVGNIFSIAQSNAEFSRYGRSRPLGPEG